MSSVLTILCLLLLVHFTYAQLSLWQRQERNVLIFNYASKGIYTASEIAVMLAAVYGFNLSVVQVRRIMRQLHVNPRRPETPHHVLSRAVREQLGSSGSLKGYRAMWRALNRSCGLRAKRDSVMVLLRNLDPIGTALRKARRLKRRTYRTKGPNYVWHADGYDKLKPYGLAIHGCIDGFSRRILWLKVASTNNDPRVIAAYYIDYVQQTGGCPRLVRTDRGTENVNMAFIQKAFRHRGQDELSGSNSHRYGRSIANQRIESLWSQVRRGRSQWWITLFKDMRDNGMFDDNDFSMDAVRFCFGPVLQVELDDFLDDWNHHRIRKNSTAETVAGVPELLYFAPSHYGADNYLCNVDEGLLTTSRDHFATVPELVSPIFKDFAHSVMDVHGVQQPTNWKESLQLYLILKEEFLRV